MQEELEQNNQTGTTEGTDEAASTPVEEVAETTVAVTEGVSESPGDESAAERVPHTKSRTGVVVSDKMDKSVVVSVTRRIKHPLYKKYFYKSRKFMVHDEENECNEGDKVRIVECRPLSSRKRWTLDTIIERAK
jgi:small subunit ribosomal protein S17